MDSLISVIIPSFNVEETIKRCILSLIEQDYSNIEILVIDDGSTDSTNAIVKELSSKYSFIKLYELPHNGVAHVRNIGIEVASGDFISFIDADDTVDFDYLSYLMDQLVTFKTDISSCQHSVVKRNGKTQSYEINDISKIYSSRDWLKKMLVRDHLDLTCCAKLYKKSIFDGIRFPEGKLFEDSSTIYKTIMESEAIAVGSKSKYNYILRNSSITTSGFNNGKFDLIFATDSMVDGITQKFPELYSEAILRMSWCYVSVLNSLLLSNNAREFNREITILQKGITSNRELINSDLNMDKRLKATTYALRFGISFYRDCLKLNSLKEAFF